MKSAMIGALIGAGLIWTLAAVGRSSDTYAQRPADAVGHASGDLVALSTSTADGRQQITVLDPRSRAMSVYHIEPKSGEIVLKSVRNITWDLQMVGHNTGNPSPQEIRELLQQIPRR